MKKLLLLIALLMCNGVFAQGSKDTVEYFLNFENRKCEPDAAHYYRLAYKEGNWWIVKDYYLVEQIKYSEGIYEKYEGDTFSVKQGVHYKIHKNGKVESKVRYVKDKKEGLEKSYDTTGRLTDSSLFKNGMPYKYAYQWYSNGNIKSKGIFDSVGNGSGEYWKYHENNNLSEYGKFSIGNKQDSVWTYYYENGVISSIETYKDDSLLAISCFDTSGTPLKTGCSAYKMPETGYDLAAFLSNNMRYPEEAKDNGIQGRVEVLFLVDKDGSIKDAKAISKYKGGGLDEEALRLIKIMPEWKPGLDHNRKVKVYYTQPITFRLE